MARSLLQTDFAYLHLRHPGMGLQLLLDEAPDWQTAMARLQGLVRQQTQLAELGFAPQVMWATASDAVHRPADLQAALSTLGGWLELPTSSQSLTVSRSQLAVLCEVSYSLLNLNELNLNGRGLTDRNFAEHLPLLAQISGLQVLSLADNQLTDGVVPILQAALATLPSLGWVSLAGNFVSQAADDELADRLLKRLPSCEAEQLTWTRLTHNAVAQLVADMPLQASLGRLGAGVAQQLGAQPALLGRVGRLRLEGIRWTEDSLAASLAALAKARSLRHLTLEVTPRIMPWERMLAPLGELVGLRVLSLGHSVVLHEDVLTLARGLPRALRGLCLLELGLPTPAWARDPAAQHHLGGLDRVLASRRPADELPPPYLDLPSPPALWAEKSPPPQPDDGPPQVSRQLNPEPYPYPFAEDMARRLSAGQLAQRGSEGGHAREVMVIKRLPGQPGTVLMGTTLV